MTFESSNYRLRGNKISHADEGKDVLRRHALSMEEASLCGRLCQYASTTKKQWASWILVEVSSLSTLKSSK